MLMLYPLDLPYELKILHYLAILPHIFRMLMFQVQFQAFLIGISQKFFTGFSIVFHFILFCYFPIFFHSCQVYLMYIQSYLHFTTSYVIYENLYISEILIIFHSLLFQGNVLSTNVFKLISAFRGQNLVTNFHTITILLLSYLVQKAFLRKTN